MLCRWYIVSPEGPAAQLRDRPLQPDASPLLPSPYLLPYGMRLWCPSMLLSR